MLTKVFHETSVTTTLVHLKQVTHELNVFCIEIMKNSLGECYQKCHIKTGYPPVMCGLEVKVPLMAAIEPAILSGELTAWVILQSVEVQLYGLELDDSFFLGVLVTSLLMLSKRLCS